MSWPVDELKLERVRALMEDRGLDALVCRAPDNVLYLTSYWCMKGYDYVVFPRVGEPTLIVIEPQEADARRTGWVADVRTFRGYDPDDPRPPVARAVDRVRDVLRERDLTGRIGIERSTASQAADRMVGEPTIPSADWFDALTDIAREVVDGQPLLTEARAIKTAQEIERMRIANELAALAMEHVAERIRPGMRESEVAALWEGHVHEVGVGYQGRVEMARGFSLVWSGPGIATFTATRDRPIVADEPTLLEIWVCADGYWSDLTKNLCPGALAPRYVELLDELLAVYRAAIGHLRPGADMAELDRLIRSAIADAGYPGQPSHPVAHGVGARAHEPPWPHQAGSGTIEAGMVLAIEPGVYWPGGGGLRIEDNFLVTAAGAEQLCRYPDDFR
ncbi:MAG: Xaa-Pro peptidase family protein [Solirubrobacteraceae bacterium]|nr:Xaa-Pro peptidase family protein [Solirubrobacteraceae bacterium]